MEQKWKQPSTDGSENGATSQSCPVSDPYARWALLTHWRGFARETREDMEKRCVRILAYAPSLAVLDRAMNSKALDISETYRNPISEDGRMARYFTATIASRALAQLDELGLRWELAAPLKDAKSVAEGSAQGFFGRQVDEGSMQASNVFRSTRSGRAGAYAGAKASKLDDAIAVIDFGGPFLNDAFAVNGEQVHRRTRVKALWDQGSHAGRGTHKGFWPWRQPQLFNHGRELGASELQAMYERMWQNKDMVTADEHAAYRGIDYLIDYDDPRRRIWFAAHGAHVLSLAGGRTDPLTGEPDSSDEESPTASNANLIFVQLPMLTAADSSGSSLSANLLDGVRYVLDQCSSDARIVVNISYGSYAGPHDGSSLLERAFDELLDARRENFAIVLGAGNSRREQCHAKRTATAGYPARLRCLLAAGDTTDTFVEIWYPRPQGMADGLKVRLRSPSGDWSDWTSPGEQSERTERAGEEEAVAAIFSEAAVHPGSPGGDVPKALILVAFAPTGQPANDGGPLIEPGIWDLEVALTGDGAPIEFDAWVERDDPSGIGSTEQPHFVGLSEGDADDTLSSLVTGKHTIAVGGFRISDGTPAFYSSIGPQRGPSSPLPLVYGACEEDDLQPNILAAAVRSGERFRMKGTSVAAPVLARRIYNLMQSVGCINRMDWRTALEGLADGKDPFVRPAGARQAEKAPPVQSERGSTASSEYAIVSE